ncbi:MAG: hypothetical protein ABIG44_14835 [Planctomycetota bacterium]
MLDVCPGAYAAGMPDRADDSRSPGAERMGCLYDETQRWEQTGSCSLLMTVDGSARQPQADNQRGTY